MNLKNNTGYILVFCAGACWGMMGFFYKMLSAMGVGVRMIAFLRITVALITIGAVFFALRGRKGFKITKQNLIVAILTGVFSLTLFNLSYIAATIEIGMSTAAVLMYTAPIFVCIMARFLFNDRLTPLKVLAIAVNISGCILTVTNGDFGGLKFSVVGVLLALLSGFLYALVTIFGKISANQGGDPLALSFYGFLCAWIIMLFVAQPWSQGGFEVNGHFVLCAVLLGTISTAVAYMLYLSGVGKLKDVSKAPIVASIEVIVATCAGIAAFGEEFGFFKAIGIAMVIASIVIVNIRTQ